MNIKNCNKYAVYENLFKCCHFEIYASDSIDRPKYTFYTNTTSLDFNYVNPRLDLLQL